MSWRQYDLYKCTVILIKFKIKVILFKFTDILINEQISFQSLWNSDMVRGGNNIVKSKG